mgnify:CR=1 FL=1
MPVTFANPHRGRDLDLDAPFPCSDASGVMQLLGQCPAHAETALLDLPELAARCGVAQVYLKDERNRMGLGSFKALGAHLKLFNVTIKIINLPARWEQIALFNQELLALALQFLQALPGKLKAFAKPAADFMGGNVAEQSR